MIRPLRLKKAGTLLALLLALGCAPKPILVPNEKVEFDGPEEAKRMVDACTVQASDELLVWSETPYDAPVAPGAKAGAGAGAVIGGVLSGPRHSVAGGALQGAAIWGGRAVNATTGERKTDEEIRREFVQSCLNGQGYEIQTWDG